MLEIGPSPKPEEWTWGQYLEFVIGLIVILFVLVLGILFFKEVGPKFF
jgi:hypothetical protein